MPQHAAGAPGAWYTRKWFRTTAWTVLLAAMAVESYYAVFVRTGDVTCHILYGQEFREGKPYTNPGNYYRWAITISRARSSTPFHSLLWRRAFGCGRRSGRSAPFTNRARQTTAEREILRRPSRPSSC